MAGEPVVSVAMITYNHRPFIGQAIESVLAQRRDFPIEIVISDDCSPDGTAKVIDEYQARHPELFVRCDPSRNIGMHANLSRVWSACRGKYIALLEGDDWWHSPEKLSTQIAFMEANADVTISGHLVRLVQMHGGGEVETAPFVKSVPQKATIQDLIAGNFLPTCSVVCRRGIVLTIPEWTSELSMGDWPLFILHAIQGTVGFIDQIHGTYRLHNGGVWSAREYGNQIERMVHALTVMQANLPPQFRSNLSLSLFHKKCELVGAYSNRGQFTLARQTLSRLKHEVPIDYENMKHILHWRFRLWSERHSILSKKRFQLLMLAYAADSSEFSVGRLARKLIRRWLTLFGLIHNKTVDISI
jgi:glycosyltransferase involved in cell wall biosynthesis